MFVGGEIDGVIGFDVDFDGIVYVVEQVQVDWCDFFYQVFVGFVYGLCFDVVEEVLMGVVEVFQFVFDCVEIFLFWGCVDQWCIVV